MSKLQIVLVGILIMAALGVWNFQRSNQQKAVLEQSGFAISERLGGSPELVLDSTRRELALIHPEGAERFSLNELQNAEIGYDDHEDRARYHYRIELSFTEQRKRRVNYATEWDAQTALERFQSLVKD
ncbi:hypothetical protein [Marinobacterium lutimaris]|uniref:Uncharacterized protein n=1 Tax=Marinobacterium lutimaris TaxID=568106 RepID=A0A1H6CHU6_9GAMM|nr:hypothetical protein [Marinobacterium lutimaris]SEG72590.1 hypothetical protein SAMN05444390_103528 [Marinobacterium lutimaris]